MVVMKKRRNLPVAEEVQHDGRELGVTAEEVEKPSDETPQSVSSARESDDSRIDHDFHEQGKTVRLSFSIDWELHRRLKLEAVRGCRTISGLVERWIGEHTAA